MGPIAAANHLLNFIAPALVVALLLVLACRLMMRQRSAASALMFITGIAVATLSKGVLGLALPGVVIFAWLLAGLVGLGRDGKMLTYAGLVVGCASAQWVLLRGWR